MKRRYRFIGVLALVMAGLVGLATPAAAFAGSENGSLNCGAVHKVQTVVRADGAHRHTIAHTTVDYPDLGYVRTSVYSSGLRSAAWTTSGGIGYYDYAASGGFCYFSP